MKSWLIKFKISNALNERKPLPLAVERAVGQSEELRRFAENSRMLDRALKSQLPTAGVSVPQHASIMRAVRAAVPAPDVENQSLWPRWIPVSSVVMLVMLGVLLAIEFPPHSGPHIQPADTLTLAAASSALELGGSLVRESPAAAMLPLSDEMQRFERDLANTKQFLLASLP